MSRENVAAACTGKERFDSFSAAERVQKRRAKRNKDFRNHWVYRCLVCQGYHLGSSGRKIERPNKAFRRFIERYDPPQ